MEEEMYRGREAWQVSVCSQKGEQGGGKEGTGDEKQTSKKKGVDMERNADPLDIERERVEGGHDDRKRRNGEGKAQPGPFRDSALSQTAATKRAAIAAPTIPIAETRPPFAVTDKDPAPLDPPPEDAAAWAFEPVAEVRLALEVAAEELLDEVVEAADDDDEEEEAPDEVLLAVVEVEVERA